MEARELENCHDCGAKPGETHSAGCDVERCSHCGSQMLMCGSEEHDPFFAQWTGIWPGWTECLALGLVRPDGGADLNKFYELGYHKIFFVKPTMER